MMYLGGRPFPAGRGSVSFFVYDSCQRPDTGLSLVEGIEYKIKHVEFIRINNMLLPGTLLYSGN